MISMSDFNTSTIQVGWDEKANRFENPDDLYMRQFNDLFRQCASKDKLPFFDTNKEVPSNLMNRNIMKDVNKNLAEFHSALYGFTSNEYVFGGDLKALKLTLDTKKNMTPLLVAAKNAYNNLDKPLVGEMNVEYEGHAQRLQENRDFYASDNQNKSVKYQFMYNIDQLDARSREKLLKITKPEREKYQMNREQQKEKMEKNFHENCSNSADEIKRNMKNDINPYLKEFPELAALYTTMFKHEVSQQKGSMNGVEKMAPEKIAEIKSKIKIGLDKLDQSNRESSRFANALLDISYRAGKTGSKVVSKDINFEQKHRQAEHQKAMENARSISR